MVDQRIGFFLKGFVLGIIAILNDALQDAQGKKTDERKCDVLYGLGALIEEIGIEIVAVAPQVSFRTGPVPHNCLTGVSTDHGDSANNNRIPCSFRGSA